MVNENREKFEMMMKIMKSYLKFLISLFDSLNVQNYPKFIVNSFGNLIAEIFKIQISHNKFSKEIFNQVLDSPNLIQKLIIYEYLMVNIQITPDEFTFF